MSKHTNFKNIPDLTGKVAIDTGANRGTEYGITFHFAKHNCLVVMAAGRNEERLKTAKESLLKEVQEATLEVESIKTFVLWKASRPFFGTHHLQAQEYWLIRQQRRWRKFPRTLNTRWIRTQFLPRLPRSLCRHHAASSSSQER